jgi:hypothetical protein
MYIIKNEKMSKEIFESECLERAFYNASVPIDLPHYEFIIFNDKRYLDSGKMFSKIAIKEIGGEYNKTVHIVKHIYQPENETFYEEDVQLNHVQLKAIQDMDTILSQKPKPKLRIIQ